MTRRDPPPSPLKTARERAGFSQAALARKVGRHPATISLAERGAVSLDMARRCAKVLGVDPAELLRDQP